jgi:hypothetical protein
MPDELQVILRMVAEGHLSPEEAAPVIEALTRPPAKPAFGEGFDVGFEDDAAKAAGERPVDPGRSGRGRQIHIRVSERGRQVVNLRIPLAFADMALRMVPGLGPEQTQRIRAAVGSGGTGAILDVEDEDGDSVLISVE